MATFLQQTLSGCITIPFALVWRNWKLANPASSSVMPGLPSILILRVYEENIHNKTEYARRSSPPFVPQVRQKMFASIFKYQTDGNENGFQKEVTQRLRRIEDLIEREMAGRTKRGK